MNIENRASNLEHRTSNTLALSYLCLLYLAAFAAAEVYTYHVGEVWGVVFDFVILFGLVLNSSLASSEEEQKLFLALGLVPLIRIVSLAVPVGEISEIYWYLVIAVIVFAGIIALMRTLNYSPEDVGLKQGDIRVQAAVALTGIAFGFIDYRILEPDSLITSLTFQRTLLPVLILMVSAGFVEELAFRGVMQRAAQALGSWGWVLIAAVYAVLQIGFGSVAHGLFAFAVMLFFGWVVKRTGSILGVGFSHGLIAVGVFLVWPHVL